MRYVVIEDKSKGLWVVQDSETKEIYAIFKEQKEADEIAAILNEKIKPDPISAKRVWNIAEESELNMVEDLLNEGYEPLGKENGKWYFRKQVV